MKNKWTDILQTFSNAFSWKEHFCDLNPIPLSVDQEDADLARFKHFGLSKKTYRKTSNISRTSDSNKFVDHSDVVGASPVGAAPTTSIFST